MKTKQDNKAQIKKEILLSGNPFLEHYLVSLLKNKAQNIIGYKGLLLCLTIARKQGKEDFFGGKEIRFQPNDLKRKAGLELLKYEKFEETLRKCAYKEFLEFEKSNDKEGWTFRLIPNREIFRNPNFDPDPHKYSSTSIHYLKELEMEKGILEDQILDLKFELKQSKKIHSDYLQEHRFDSLKLKDTQEILLSILSNRYSSEKLQELNAPQLAELLKESVKTIINEIIDLKTNKGNIKTVMETILLKDFAKESFFKKHRLDINSAHSHAIQAKLILDNANKKSLGEDSIKSLKTVIDNLLQHFSRFQSDSIT